MSNEISYDDLSVAKDMNYLSRKKRLYSYSNKKINQSTLRDAHLLPLIMFLRIHQIAVLYGLSSRSVEYHLNNIKVNLNVHLMKDLIKIVERSGFYKKVSEVKVTLSNHQDFFLAKRFIYYIKLMNPSSSCFFAVFNAICYMSSNEKNRLIYLIKRTIT